jgi:hypothetical protein
VALNDTTNGAKIYFTMDGSTPTMNSWQFIPGINHPLNVPFSVTIKAIAVASGCKPSAVGVAVYTLPASVGVPTFSPQPGTYGSVQTITMSDTTSPVYVFYTIDGTTPTENSQSFYGLPPNAHIQVNYSQTIKAIAVAPLYDIGSAGASAMATATYVIDQPQTAAPTFSVAGGTYTSPQMVAMTDATPDANIIYTTDGSTPTISSAEYVGPVTVSSTQTIKAMALAPGHNLSPVASVSYTINLPSPSFTLSAASTSITVSAGGSSATTLTVTSQNGFNSAVSFACSGLPVGVTCAFSPTAVTPPNGNQATTQLTIAASSSASMAKPGGRTFLPCVALAVALGFIGIGRRRRQFNCLLLFLIAALPLIAAISACGGGGGGSGPTPPPPENATVKVTATSGSLQQAVTIALKVN